MASRTHYFVVLGLGLLSGLGACTTAAQAPPAVPDLRPLTNAAAADCSVADRPGDPVAIVGLTETVAPANAPVPQNDSERLFFRQVYDTLVRVGCDSRVQPGLAIAWQQDAAGAWLVTLRQNARFSDGTAVTAREIVSGWTRGGTSLSPDVARIVRTATALDDVTLSVVLQEEHARPGPLTGIGRLASPALSVARTTPDAAWPLGTRGFAIESDKASPASGRTTLNLVPTLVPTDADTDAGRRAIRFVVLPTGDGRDLLDQGVDLLVTREPAALTYAATLAQYDSIPLPWSRSYVFLSRSSGPATALPQPLRQRLADDAVPGEAQGSAYDFPSAWDSCAADATSPSTLPPAPAASRPAAAPSRRIVYDQSDSVARALAERIVVLASARSGEHAPLIAALLQGDRSRTLQTAALPAAVLPSALMRGDDAGYVIALEKFNGCAELTALREQATWLTRDNPVPLVDTRARALIRKDRSRLAIEWDGGLRFDGPSAR
jgi:hypothetical protein